MASKSKNVKVEEDIEESDPEETSDIEASDTEEESEAEESDAEAEAEESDPEAEASDPEAEASDAEEEIEKEGVGTTATLKKPLVSNIGIEMLKTTKKTSEAAKTKKEESDTESEESEAEESEADDVNYLQKFDSKMRDNFILDHHPEARTHNYEEVKALTRVTRDGRGIIIDPLHKTIPFLTKYEMTRVIGQRAKQLDSGAKSFAKVPINVIDGYYIALLELEQKKLPFIIKRPYPNGGVEYWNVSDLELLI
jgi:DNA-directed RNA polymerase subunit K/omega